MKVLLFILFSLICYTSYSQANKQFLDSISKLCDSKGYNRLDHLKRRQGYWIHTASFSRMERPDEIRTYSGFYNSGKKIGLWEQRKYGLRIRMREVYMDTTELRKMIVNFDENGIISDEGDWIFDPIYPDTIQTFNPVSEKLDTTFKKGKFVMSGMFRNYWANGMIKSYGKMENNKEKGAWLYYNPKGELIETKMFY